MRLGLCITDAVRPPSLDGRRTDPGFADVAGRPVAPGLIPAAVNPVHR